MPTREGQALADAALVWWIDQRPVEYGEREHLANPTINTPGPNEAAVAECVAAMVRLKYWGTD